MIQILLCDDDKKSREKLSNKINKYMEEAKAPCEVVTFEDYDSKFEKYLKKPHCKRVYFLDIETPSQSGIDVARKIRTNDLSSIIIFVTGHDNMANTIIKNDLFILAYINKFDDYDNKIDAALERVLKLTDCQPTLQFVDNYTNYKINFNDILYISRDVFDRKSIITTTTDEYKTIKTITELKKILSDQFIQTHRSCIINYNRMAKYDKKNKIVKFDNGASIDLVSPKYYQELLDRIEMTSSVTN